MSKDKYYDELKRILPLWPIVKAAIEKSHPETIDPKIREAAGVMLSWVYDITGSEAEEKLKGLLSKNI